MNIKSYLTLHVDTNKSKGTALSLLMVIQDRVGRHTWWYTWSHTHMENNHLPVLFHFCLNKPSNGDKNMQKLTGSSVLRHFKRSFNMCGKFYICLSGAQWKESKWCWISLMSERYLNILSWRNERIHFYHK
jgi:hypothetical protein